MSVKGFRFNDVVHKYDYDSLDNIPTPDKTLTKDGEAADSKTVGDAITTLHHLVGTPLVASSAASMTDRTKIYVYTGSETGYVNGHWYYFDGTLWADGGVYNSTAFETDKTLTVENAAADAKKTGDSLDDLKSALDAITNSKTEAIPASLGYVYINFSLVAGKTYRIISDHFATSVKTVDGRITDNQIETFGALTANTPKMITPTISASWLRFYFGGSGAGSVTVEEVGTRLYNDESAIETMGNKTEFLLLAEKCTKVILMDSMSVTGTGNIFVEDALTNGDEVYALIKTSDFDIIDGTTNRLFFRQMTVNQSGSAQTAQFVNLFDDYYYASLTYNATYGRLSVLYSIGNNSIDLDLISFGKNGIAVKADEKPVYVSPAGSDTNSGTESSPYRTIGRALADAVKTIILDAGVYNERFVASGFEELNILLNKSESTSINSYAKIRRAEQLTATSDSSTGLLKCVHSYTSGDILDKVFISRTQAPTYTHAGGSLGYAVSIFENGGTPETTIGLKPVLSVQACQDESGTFTYDGTSFYINPAFSSSNEFWYSINDDNAVGIAQQIASFKDIKKLYVENVSIEFSPYLAEYIDNVNDAKFVHCRCLGTANSGGFRSYNSNVEYDNCESYRCGSDGFASVGAGNVNLKNCTGAYNRDDGVSHHANATGYIDGGVWHHNRKGGIASPVQGARVDMCNAFCHNNGYGVYIAKEEQDNVLTPCRISNVACWDNTINDLYISYGWDVLAKGCLWTSKSVSASSQLLEL